MMDENQARGWEFHVMILMKSQGGLFQNIRLDIFLWKVTVCPVGTHSGASELSPLRFEIIPWNRNIENKTRERLLIYLGQDNPEQKGANSEEEPSKEEESFRLERAECRVLGEGCLPETNAGKYEDEDSSQAAQEVDHDTNVWNLYGEYQGSDKPEDQKLNTFSMHL